MLWQWIAFGLCFFLCRQFISTAREARALLGVMIALAVALAGYGLLQRFYELPMSRARYEENPVAALQEAELPYEPGSREWKLFEQRLYSTEPFGTFELANSLAGLLAPWLVVAVAIGACSGLEGKQQVFHGRATAVCCLPIALCLLLTKSRSGYVATLLGIALVGWLCRSRVARGGWKLLAAVALAGAILVAVVLAVGGVDRQVLSEAPLSLGYRVQYWRASMAMIADHPMLGCGPGQFQNAYTLYKLPEASEEVADPHNFLLEIWATAGTPAALAMLAVLGCFGWALWPRPRREPSPPEKPTAVEPGPAADSTYHVLGGAALGFLLSVPLSLICSAPPSPNAVLLGLPLAAAAVVLLRGWIQRGQLSAALPAIAVVVLLVNLSAAGGIGFPGVAGTLWLLMAVGLAVVEARPTRSMSQGGALAGLAALIGLAVACYFTAYSPVLRCRAGTRLAQQEPRRADEHLLAAAKADPWAADPWKRLAARAFFRWETEPTAEAFSQVERYQQEALRLDPQSPLTWLAFGDRYLEAYGNAKQERYIQKATEAYREAVRLYPNSPLCRAKLAIALRIGGDEAAFRRQADEALRLDEVNPHVDNKLPDELRNRLKRNGFQGV